MEKTNVKHKRFHKKKVLLIGLLSLLVVGLVSAGVLTYFGRINTNVDVDRAITFEGSDCSEDVCTEAEIPLGAGETSETSEYTLTSQTSVDGQIEIVSTYDEVCLTVTNQYNLDADSIVWDAITGYTELTYEDFEAGRSYITVLTDITLSELNNIDFEQYVGSGYPVSVNILLDVNEDGEFDSKKDLTDGLLTDGEDAVLKIEFAYNGATAGYPDAYMESEDYNTWSFDGVGSIDDTTDAWLYSVKAGGAEIIMDTLTNWKLGINRGTSCYYVTDAWYEEACDDIIIDGDTRIYAIQIENLGWIAQGDSKVRNVEINGVPQNILTLEGGQDIAFNLAIESVYACEEDIYTIVTEIQPQ